MNSDMNETDNLIERTSAKAKRGNRKVAEARANMGGERPKRTPVSGHRNILTVEGKNADFEYRYVKDADHSGHRILRFKDAGYELATSDQGIRVGDNFIHKTGNIGNVIRVPAGVGEYLYLMRIRKEFYEEDQKAKADEILALENQYRRKGKEEGSDGLYGTVEIGSQ